MHREYTAKLSCLILGVALLFISGCVAGKRSLLVAPGAPQIAKDFDFEQLARYRNDYNSYTDAAEKDPQNLDRAKLYRDKILERFMGDIDSVYHEYSDGFYIGKQSQAIAGDIVNLGLTAATAMSLVTRTKTLLAALATGVAGVNLSVDKNFFGQQTFSALSIAMQARRDRMRATISANEQLAVSLYSLDAVRRDLVAYFYAGTLPGAIQEIQEEAAGASQHANAPGASTLAAPQSVAQPARSIEHLH